MLYVHCTFLIIMYIYNVAIVMLCLFRNPVMIVPYKTDEICYKNGDRF